MTEWEKRIEIFIKINSWPKIWIEFDLNEVRISHSPLRFIVFKLESFAMSIVAICPVFFYLLHKFPLVPFIVQINIDE